MSFLKVKKEVIEKTGNGGAYITQSGLYDVTIGALTLDINEHGARTIGAYITLDGENYQMLYGALPLDLFDGSQEIEGNVNTLMRLATIAGFESIEDPVEMALPIGKEGADKDILVFDQFSDLPCKLWVKVEYSKGKKNGVIYENRIIKDAFREDGASADEIANESEIGVKMTKREKYFTETKYKDTDEAEVAAWIEAGRPKTASTGTAAKTTVAPKRKFGAK